MQVSDELGWQRARFDWSGFCCLLKVHCKVFLLVVYLSTLDLFFVFIGLAKLRLDRLAYAYEVSIDPHPLTQQVDLDIFGSNMAGRSRTKKKRNFFYKF